MAPTSRLFPPPNSSLSPPPPLPHTPPPLFHPKFSLSSSSPTLSLTKLNHRHCQFSSSAASAQFLHNPQILPLTSTPIPSLPPSEVDPFSLEDAEIVYRKCLELLQLSVRYGDVEVARAVHSLALKLEGDNYLENSLITPYLNLGLPSDAYNVFASMSSREVVSYTALISGLAKSGYEVDAIGLFFRMRERESTFVANAVMGMPMKCGSLDDALSLFDEMPERDIASCNTVISGVVNGFVFDRAFELFRGMQRIDGFRVDHFTLSSLLDACAGCSARKLGREIHAYVLKVGCESNLSVNNVLIGFYTKCGGTKDVQTVFERMPTNDVISWNAMISAYMEFGMVDLAMEIFYMMPERNPCLF